MNPHELVSALRAAPERIFNAAGVVAAESANVQKMEAQVRAYRLATQAAVASDTIPPADESKKPTKRFPNESERENETTRRLSQDATFIAMEKDLDAARARADIARRDLERERDAFASYRAIARVIGSVRDE